MIECNELDIPSVMKRLAKKELEIMNHFWDKGPMFVKELRELYDEPRPHVNTLSTLVRLLESNGQFLAYETGQEPLDLLLAVMADIGTDNQRINFDPANLLYYNNNDPMEFVEKVSDRIVHIHCKDAVRPLPGAEFGRETRLGEGDTNFCNLFRKLYAGGYRGPLTIEREIREGEELDRDIRNAIRLLEKLKSECAAPGICTSASPHSLR